MPLPTACTIAWTSGARMSSSISSRCARRTGHSAMV